MLGFAKLIRSAGTICRSTLPFVYMDSTLPTRVNAYISGRPLVCSKYLYMFLFSAG